MPVFLHDFWNYVYTHYIKVFARFTIVGIINTLIGMLIIYSIFWITGIHYLIVNTIGYIINFFITFITHKLFTFQSKKRSIREVILYFVIFLLSFLANLGVTYLAGDILMFSKNLAILLGIGTYVLLSFIGNRIFTFPIQKTSEHTIEEHTIEKKEETL